MTGKKPRLMSMAGAILLLVLTGVAGAGARAVAADGPVDLSARMLQTSDLPPGFQPYAPMTGPLNAQRAGQFFGVANASVAGLVHGWVHYWFSSATGQQVIELVLDSGTSRQASDASAGFGSSMSAQGATRQQLTADMTGYTAPLQVNGSPFTLLATPLARGPFFFALEVLCPAQSTPAGAGLLANLAAAQDSKVPADTPDTGTSLSGLQADPYEAGGGVIGGLVAYLALVDAIASRRNPLRRRRGERSLEEPVQPAGQFVLDVSERARKYRKTARLRLAVQLIGLALIACGADPFLVPDWYLLVLAGAVVTWAGGRFIRPAGLAPGGYGHILSGARRVRVTVLTSLAFVLVVAGALALLAYGLNQSEPAVVQAVNAASGGPTTGQASAFAYIGIILTGTGAVLARRARRLAAVDANRLMQRDARPPVLYLRSFGDDALKLWTATFGRPSLLERFTPRRFDAFEEVIARQFARTGPVIALNPPDTRLAPLGAARETLDSADWQATISDWMSRSAVIVFVMPPGQVTRGLAWELQQVSANQYWNKTLVIVPPVPASLLRARWQGFLAACGTLWPFNFPLPVTVSKPLALTFRNGGWTAIRASKQDEWTYGAAISEALGRPPLPFSAVAGEPGLTRS